HRAAAFVAIADERERVFLLRTIGPAQQRHAEHVRIEIDRPLQIADAKHCVKYPHDGSRSFYISIISKSSLRAPHSGQHQFGGRSSHLVPGGMPSSGAPAASS